MDNSMENAKGFFSHVFRFDEDSKIEITNLIQYALLSIVPVVLLNKTMQRYFPEADPTKGSLELIIEIVVQVMMIFIALLVIHRMVVYIPRYSGGEYPDIQLIVSVLPLLFITLGFQTKIGEKSAILWDRVQDAWTGAPPEKPVEVSRPVMQPTPIFTETNTSAPTDPTMSQGGGNYTLPAPDATEFTPANELVGGSFGSTW
jgi:hypothetical protein